MKASKSVGPLTCNVMREPFLSQIKITAEVSVSYSFGTVVHIAPRILSFSTSGMDGVVVCGLAASFSVDCEVVETVVDELLPHPEIRVRPQTAISEMSLRFMQIY